MRAISIAAFFLLAVCQIASAQSDLILGVLEDGPGDVYGEPNIRSVRIVFKKANGEWQPYRTVAAAYPHEVTWTIAFDGKNLGQVTGSTLAGNGKYWRVGQQKIISNGPVPTVGKRSAEFGGNTDAVVYRPLVAVSQPNFHDPDVWKPAVLAPDALHSLFRQFRQAFPNLCRTSPADNTQLVPYPYEEKDVKAVKSYSSTRGWVVARLHLQGAIDCADTEAGFEIDDPWFVIDDKGSARFLDSGMFLVDAGDYDADGTSELVFSISSDNRGGYRIYYDDFKKRAEFEFSYH